MHVIKTTTGEKSEAVSQTRKAQQARAAAKNYGGGTIANSMQKLREGPFGLAAQVAEWRRRQEEERQKRENSRGYR